MNNSLFSHLKQEHSEVKQILEELAKTTSNAAKSREKLFGKLTQKLLPHMAAEEGAFYSVLQEKKEVMQDVLEAFEEHHAARNVFDELVNLPFTEANWGAKLNVFKEMIEHHIKEEEGQIFKDTREALSPEQIEKIFIHLKEIEENHLHTVGKNFALV